MNYIFVIFGIFSCSISQLLLKKSANGVHKSKLFEIINPMVLFSYLIFFGSLLINIWAMNHGLLLKEVSMLESLGYVFVPVLSSLVLKERILKRTIVAILIILIGIFVFYL